MWAFTPDFIVEVFPASAGVILIASCPIWLYGGFPRIRGGDPVIHAYRNGLIEFSPHPRG